MKVVLVTPYSWTTPGGVNSHIRGLAEALRARGHETRILAPADGPVPAGVVSLGRSVPIPYNGSVARVAFGPRVAARVRIALRRAAPDIVHVHEPFAPSASLLATIASRAPCVGTFHADAPESRLYRTVGPALGPLWRRLAARIAVSEAARATVTRVFHGEVEIIPNGVSISRFASVSSVPETGPVVFLGRLERRKGAHILIEAAPAVRALVGDARIVIAGDGPQRRELERSIPAAARDAVTFAGPLSAERVLELASEARAFCFPSLGGESFGVVLLEAMAAGRPVVASAIPGYEAVVRDGVEGILVPPGDAPSLARAIARVLDDPQAAAAMGERGRARAAEYDWGRLVGRVEAAYERAAGAV